MPLSINFEAVVSAYKKPEQAADISNAQILPAPILSAIRQAVEGNSISGVTVAQIIRSISCAEVFVFFNKPSMAFTPISEEPFWPLRILLSLIPVLVVIHSSFVSTSFSNSLLFKIYSGTYP